MFSNLSYNLLKRVIKQVRPFWPHLTGLFLLTLVATPIALLKPLPLKILIDSGFGEMPLPGFIQSFFSSDNKNSFYQVALATAMLVVLIALIENLQILVSWVLHAFTGERMVLNFKKLLFDHIQRLSIAYHDRKGTSDALYRLQFDTQAIRSLLMGGLSPLISALLSLLGMIGVMMFINWRFALIAISIIPPLIYLMQRSTSRLQRDWLNVKEHESKAMSVVHEVLNALRVVKAFGQETGEAERFVSRAGQAVEGQVKVAWTGAKYYFISGIILSVGTALFMYYGATSVYAGNLSLGELTLIIAYLAQIFGPLETISKTINDIQSSLASIDRVYNLLDEQKEVMEIADPVSLNRAKGAVKFCNVSFSYEDKAPALRNISFEIQPGQRVGIMGSTGAGKSTLINLLTRFYDPSSGSIQVDGVDIKNYKLSDYRNQFGIVLQDPVLFSTTVRENIAYGKPGAGENEIIEAAKSANAHEFIISTPDGYDTLVGERGMQLSGGERQRISIARAFIKNAPILILDEPTSSVDVRTEALIMEAMERLMAGRTTFLITHRLDTLNACNVLIHLEKGQIKDMVQNHDAEYMEKTKMTLLKNIH